MQPSHTPDKQHRASIQLGVGVHSWVKAEQRESRHAAKSRGAPGVKKPVASHGDSWTPLRSSDHSASTKPAAFTAPSSWFSAPLSHDAPPLSNIQETPDSSSCAPQNLPSVLADLQKAWGQGLICASRKEATPSLGFHHQKRSYQSSLELRYSPVAESIVV